MIAESVTTAVTIEIFKKTYGSVLEYLRSQSTKLNKLKPDVELAYRKGVNVENVKTIWQIDRAVNLNSFYYPSKVVVGKSVKEIASLSCFPDEAKYVIQGTAGQGKSIFLRFLAGKEFKVGSKIPIFIELRKISERKSLEGLIIDGLDEIGIKCDSSDLEHVFGSRKFALLLDAFDEVPDGQVKDTINYIESLCNKYHFIQVLVTARPESSIQMCPQFSVLNLDKIKPSDFKPILDKFFDGDQSIVQDIISSMHKSASNISSLITTPLLLTLLTITYKGSGKIPESPYEFYEGLFSLLAHRHDSTKPGFIRRYSSNLNVNQMEELFCAFCFYCMVESKLSMNTDDIYGTVKKAVEFSKIIPVSESSYVKDCMKNTCLIVEEGGYYSFIHKSIREYYSSRFIKNSPRELKVGFYNRALSSSYTYAEEIKYLSNIDKYDFGELFWAPLYNRVLEYFCWDGISVSCERLFNDVNMYVEKGGITSYSISGGCVIFNSFSNYESYFNKFISLVGAELASSIAEGVLSNGRDYPLSEVFTDYKGIFDSIFIDLCKDTEVRLLDLNNEIESRKNSIAGLFF